jgi:hypothetical protein
VTVGLGGAEGIRTPDLRSAIAALSQLSYGPAAGTNRPNKVAGFLASAGHLGRWARRVNGRRDAADRLTKPKPCVGSRSSARVLSLVRRAPNR